MYSQLFHCLCPLFILNTYFVDRLRKSWLGCVTVKSTCGLLCFKAGYMKYFLKGRLLSTR